MGAGTAKWTENPRGAGNDGHYFEHDAAGPLTKYRDFDDEPGGTREYLAYTYDAAGQVITMTDYDGDEAARGRPLALQRGLGYTTGHGKAAR